MGSPAISWFILPIVLLLVREFVSHSLWYDLLTTSLRSSRSLVCVIFVVYAYTICGLNRARLERRCKWVRLIHTRLLLLLSLLLCDLLFLLQYGLDNAITAVVEAALKWSFLDRYAPTFFNFFFVGRNGGFLPALSLEHGHLHLVVLAVRYDQFYIIVIFKHCMIALGHFFAQWLPKFNKFFDFLLCSQRHLLLIL